MKQALVALLERSIQSAIAAGLLSAAVTPRIEVEWTKDPSHGDYASNVAMILASQNRKNPREIAKILSERIDDSGQVLEKVEIAGPGFLNFFIREGCWSSLLKIVDGEGDRYGSAAVRKGPAYPGGVRQRQSHGTSSYRSRTGRRCGRCHGEYPCGRRL